MIKSITILLVLLVGCASTGQHTIQDKLNRMHACQRVGGIWITAASTPEYEGRCSYRSITGYVQT